MTTVAGRDLRERVDGTVAVSVERTGLLSRLVGVLFGGRSGGASTWRPAGFRRGSEPPAAGEKSDPEALA
jgi:hypothetical protein